MHQTIGPALTAIQVSNRTTIEWTGRPNRITELCQFNKTPSADLNSKVVNMLPLNNNMWNQVGHLTLELPEKEGP